MLRLPNLPHEIRSGRDGRRRQPGHARPAAKSRRSPSSPKSHVELVRTALKLVDFARGHQTLRQRLSALHQLGCQAGAGADPVHARFAYRASTAIPKFRRRSWSDRTAWRASASSRNSQTSTTPCRRAWMPRHLGKLYLIPTAETPVANIHREEILPESQLAHPLLRLYALFPRRSRAPPASEPAA